MSIVQFLRILWVHRLLTVFTTLATLIGALVAVLVVPPSYEAKTRVMLNTLKPDPVTGEVVAAAGARTYLATQQELIRDVTVAGQAADTLGWLSNPEVIQNYNADKGQDLDLRRSMAQRIIDRTKAEVVGGTNILEISFRAPTPDDARTMANALRDAFIDTTLSSRRREANRNAEWYTQQADKERDLVIKADAEKTAFERSSGIVMQDEKTDSETARLRSLSGQSGIGTIIAAPGVMQASPSSIQLAQLDAQMSQLSKTLGPNHPQMAQMKSQRETLARLAAQDQASALMASSAASRAASENAGAMSRAVNDQTNRVIANRDKIEKLSQLQAQVILHKTQMEKSLARATELRQEAAVADSGITVLSEAVTPRKPAFPNKPLIFGGAFGLGAAIGLFLSLLIELFRRRVRGVEDLVHAVDAPLLGVVTAWPAPKAVGSKRRPSAVAA